MDIYKKALDVIINCNIKSFPFDCMEVLKLYKFKVRTYEQIKQQNIQIYNFIKCYSDDAFSDRNTMFLAYNDQTVDGRIKFSLMHELGHHILQHKGKSPQNEIEADTFSAYILAPFILIQHYKCKNAEDVKNKFGLSITAANIAWQNYRRWKRHAPTFADIDLLNWILYLRKPNEITESNMYQVNPFDCVLEPGRLVSLAVSESDGPINPDSPKSDYPRIDASDCRFGHEKKEPSRSHDPQGPPPYLVNASPLPKKDPKRSEKMRRYHKKKRMQIEKELAQVREDMDSLHRMDADFLGAAENNWLYK